MKKLSRTWTTVTPFSKMLALSMFIIIPIAAFYLGIYHEQQTRKGFPNPFCKKWDTVCDPNIVDPHGKCAPKTVCVDPSPTPTITADYPAELDAMINLAKENLATKLSLTVEKLNVISAEETTWNDGSLGCPKPGMMYTQSLVSGYHVVLSDGTKEYDYRLKKDEEPFLCENPR